MTVDTEAISKEADKLHQRYASRFANKPRITRDTDVLDTLIDEMGKLLETVASVDSVLEVAITERLSIYHKEREAISEAQSAGPLAIEATVLGQRANFVMNRYRRHFAGKARTTRDLGLLAECVNNLKAILGRMKEVEQAFTSETLTRDIEVVERNIRLYVKERGEIVAARGMGLIDQKAELLAEIANAQFALYPVHFSGKSRLSRRPALIQRMVDNLTQYRDRMVSHKEAGLRSESNDQNIRTITDHLKFYRREKFDIEQARQDSTDKDYIDSLAKAANNVMAEYGENFAGKQRASCDSALLSNLCDQLGEVESLMHDLNQEKGTEANRRNLGIVKDMLELYEREYREVVKAKAKK
jgi:hypothetical protein